MATRVPNLTRHATGKRLEVSSKDVICSACSAPWHEKHLLRQGFPLPGDEPFVCPRCQHECCCQIECDSTAKSHRCCHLRRKQLKERKQRNNSSRHLVSRPTAAGAGCGTRKRRSMAGSAVPRAIAVGGGPVYRAVPHPVVADAGMVVPTASRFQLRVKKRRVRYSEDGISHEDVDATKPSSAAAAAVSAQLMTPSLPLAAPVSTTAPLPPTPPAVPSATPTDVVLPTSLLPRANTPVVGPTPTSPEGPIASLIPNLDFASFMDLYSTSDVTPPLSLPMEALLLSDSSLLDAMDDLSFPVVEDVDDVARGPGSSAADDATFGALPPLDPFAAPSTAAAAAARPQFDLGEPMTAAAAAPVMATKPNTQISPDLPTTPSMEPTVPLSPPLSPTLTTASIPSISSLPALSSSAAPTTTPVPAHSVPAAAAAAVAPLMLRRCGCGCWGAHTESGSAMGVLPADVRSLSAEDLKRRIVDAQVTEVAAASTWALRVQLGTNYAPLGAHQTLAEFGLPSDAFPAVFIHSTSSTV